MSEFYAGGELGELARARDWHSTGLGQARDWPPALRVAANLILNSQQPMFIAWGPELNFIYNDGYAPILGARHPWALGQPFHAIWPEIWTDIAPLIESALAGRSTWMENMHLVMARNGAPEDTWYTFSYSPIFDEDGSIGGMMCSCVETTQQVQSSRLSDFRLRLNSELRVMSDPAKAMDRAAELLGIQLGVARVGYGDIDESGEYVVVERDWTDGTLGSVAGRHRMEAFGPAIIEELRAGRVMSVDDVNQDDRVGSGAEAFEAIGTRSVLAVPLLRAGRFRAMLYLHHHSPKRWSTDDMAFAGETLERTWEAVERARAEAMVRESEERLRFLDDLGQRTADLVNADEILTVTTRALGEHLGISICAYADMDEDEDGFTIRGDWFQSGSGSIVGRYRLADFGQLAVDNLGAGQPLIISDNAVELAPHEAATFQNIGIAATICMPLVKNGRLTALMAIHDRVPRLWTERELSLLREVTERSWAHIERVGALAELKGSVVQQQATARELAEVNRNLEALVDQRTTELMAAEETLRQSQKMEAVGQLTGGLAHDFNNLLAGIGGSLEIMGTRLAQGRISEVDRYLTAASGAVRRAASLTQRLLAFSRRQTLDPRPVDVAALAEGMLDLINRTVGPAISVTTNGDANLGATFVDSSQLENSLLNLCLNARDAMPHGGSIAVDAANRTIDDRAARLLGLEPGEYIQLAVNDTGIGMPPDVVARAFDPFFTTKPIGQGTGLGLSMVYGFAGQSGGTVHIASEVGTGTTITIYLPRYFGGQADAQPVSVTEANQTQRRESILLV
ncbi:MAG TPA: GAF domain-containing protein, partial [Devosia sp.]|nr:GAF domain-containing protein [Devosia sp.]